MVCPYPRNLTDDEMKALARRGGVMSLTFVPGFISLGSPAGYENYTPSSPLFLKWVDHCDRAMQLVAGACDATLFCTHPELLFALIERLRTGGQRVRPLCGVAWTTDAIPSPAVVAG